MPDSPFIPKLKAVGTFIVHLVGVLTALTPILIYTYSMAAEAADKKARAYIQLVVDQRFNDLGIKVDKLTAAINRLSTGQTAVNQQSAEQERLSRQILCLQQVQADPNSGTVDGCMAGQ